MLVKFSSRQITSIVLLLLIIIISVCGVFFGPEAIKGEIFGQINGLVGDDAANQIQEVIKNVHLSKSNKFATTVGVIMLLIGASGVFAEIQDTINYIWGLKAKPNRGWIKFLKNRLMSFSMIFSPYLSKWSRTSMSTLTLMCFSV